MMNDMTLPLENKELCLICPHMSLPAQDMWAMLADEDSWISAIFDFQHDGLRIDCPKCQEESRYYKVKKRKAMACSNCGHQIHPLANTIAHKSSTPINYWVGAMYHFAISSNGVSAKELQRMYGVTYKTAWRMAKDIRGLMYPDDDILSGVVEADETYVGGKARGKRGRGAANKTPIFGVVERGGKVFALPVQNTKANTLMPIICDVVEPGTKLMTDEYRSYGSATTYGFVHQTVQHGIKEYVRGDVHTNTLEGFWSQLKRSIHGTHHTVSAKYLGGLCK